MSSGICGVIQSGEGLEEDHGKGEAFERLCASQGQMSEETGLKFQVGSLGLQGRYCRMGGKYTGSPRSLAKVKRSVFEEHSRGYSYTKTRRSALYQSAEALAGLSELSRGDFPSVSRPGEFWEDTIHSNLALVHTVHSAFHFNHPDLLRHFLKSREHFPQEPSLRSCG